MASTLVKIDIHITFHVKSTGMTIRPSDLGRLFTYIAGILKKRNAIPFEIGGMPDHLHILTSLPKDMTLSNLVRDIKADSSKWIKALSPDYHTFAWQEGYGAFSVSPSLLDKTVQYIRQQPQHHQKMSFQEEYKMFLDAYHMEYDEKFAFGD